MKTSLAALALAAVAALLLSACNGTNASGPSQIAPLPNEASALARGGVHRNDNGPGDLHAGGADFPGLAYNLADQPVGYYNQSQNPPGKGSLFASAPTKGAIFYCLNSSTDGRHAFEDYDDSGYPPTGPCAALGQSPTGFGGRSDPLDFVGSAVAMPSTEYTYYKQYREPSSGTSWGEPFEFPQIGGVIALPYRPGDFSNYVKHIKLSTWTYCAIANGTVGDWNDPAITADNGASVTGNSSQAITFYFRSDSGGTTYNFVNHLNTACNVTFKAPYDKSPYQGASRSAAWTFGVSSSWPGPGSSNDPNTRFIGETGAPGILNAVQNTAYSTGYLEGSYARAAQPAVAQAWLQNGRGKKGAVFIDPTQHLSVLRIFKNISAADINYGEGSDELPLGTSAPWCVLYVDPKYFVSPPAGAYPIAAISYLLFYGQNNGVHVPDKIALIKYVESKKADTLINKFEYAGLAPSIRSAVLTALNGKGNSQPACLQ